MREGNEGRGKGREEKGRGKGKGEGKVASWLLGGWTPLATVMVITSI